MIVQCDCGKFQGEISNFPQSSLGRVACYCDDCQAFLNKLGRSELLDEYGGTEIMPVYPCDFKFLHGAENLKCNRLKPNGLNRWSTTCCNSPIANNKPGFWIGIFRNAYTCRDSGCLTELGPIRSRIMGKFAKPNPPFYIPKSFDLNAFRVVFPFLLRGKLTGKFKRSPFFKEDSMTPVKEVNPL